ncbi:uncharacterized protein LOC112089851 [Eutrema salsugineum]|uniref:uncharacterized protein LOC112089851 n=1 Tax=Eutrema salsugineum TaxID=72664 RepID=UPI000CED09BC|nr:uncharacterized protein LOC112089851 [Eutrema salsugineum]
MSPFEIVYEFNPKTPMEFTPLPPAEAVSLDGERSADLIKKLHQKAKENLEKRTEQYVKHANKGRKEVVFEPGDWVWLHMRHERFPNQRSSKLAPRGDGPFKILEKINNNAYKLELPGEFNISSTFNVSDLAPYIADDPVLRSKPLEEGGNDEAIQAEPDLTEPQLQDVEIPVIHEGPITRQRAKILQYKYNQSMLQAMSQVDQERPREDHEQVEPHNEAHQQQAWTGLLEECQELANGPASKSQDIWPLLPNQAQVYMLTISPMNQDT